MTFKEIKKKLGYETIKEMLQSIGMSEQNLSQIKRNNPKRYELIKIDIILKHHDINAVRLLDIIEIHAKIKEVAQCKK